ncbi:type II toxin-antitoxin system RelB/DinJ family antitoxin [Salmonella enterica]
MGKIQSRIPDDIENVATAVIEATGLTVSGVVRMIFTRIANERAIPTELFQPNAETVQAMLDAREGRTTPTTIDHILASIDAEQSNAAPKAAK